MRRGGGQATAAPTSVALLLAMLAIIAVCDAVQVNVADLKGSGQIEVQLVQTAEKTLDRLTPKPNLSFQPVTSSLQNTNQFYIEATNPNARFQTILGFGGAFTEAAAVNFAGLNPLLQDLILDAYWGENGIGYSIGRVHMNSCDFCIASYNFDNVTGDVGLKHFDTNVTHDQRHMIPFIKRANETFLKTRSNANSRGLKVFASPWSPPGWMKIPIPPHGAQTMDGSATPQGLKDQYFQSWALYYSKFLTAYKQQGVNLWGITVQNEPENAAEWEACVYNATAEKFFVEKFLGPQIQQDHPEITLMAYDHNRDHVYDWAQVMYSDPSISQFVDGIAFHWYEGQYYHHLNQTHFIKPEKFLLATEACNGPGVILGDWARGESYGQDILADLQFWSVGWTDWNMVLNTIGGPNHVQNYCDAPVIGDLVNQSIYFQPTYYYMGQISKYVRPGSQRIQVRSQANLQDPVSAVPFVNNGNNLITYQCQNSAQQRWGLDSSTNEIYLLNTQGGRYCWDLQDSNTADGANVFVWSCTGGANQKWNFIGLEGGYFGTIASNLAGKCVEVMDGSQDNGGNIQISTCTGAQNQLWYWDRQTNNIFAKIQGRFGVPSAVSPPEMCATSGWTTFQSVGFLTPEKDAVVLVVMNSGNHQVPFSLLTDAYSGQEVVTSIPPHAIQTYSFPLKE